MPEISQTLSTDGGDFQTTMVASPSSPGEARAFVEKALHKLGCQHVAYTARLVTSELVTNAAEAVPGQEIRVRLALDDGMILIEVSDPSSDIPMVRDSAIDLDDGNFDNNGGWGIPLVFALTKECGYRSLPGGGKVMWAYLAEYVGG